MGDVAVNMGSKKNPVSMRLQNEIAGMVAQYPHGVTTIELALKTGRTAKSMKNIVFRAAQSGLIVRVGGSIYARWCVQSTRHGGEAYAAALKRASGLLWRQRAKEKRAAAQEVRIREILDVRQRVLPACKAPPIPKLGPASVFDYAAQIGGV